MGTTTRRHGRAGEATRCVRGRWVRGAAGLRRGDTAWAASVQRVTLRECWSAVLCEERKLGRIGRLAARRRRGPEHLRSCTGPCRCRCDCYWFSPYPRPGRRVTAARQRKRGHPRCCGDAQRYDQPTDMRECTNATVDSLRVSTR